MKLKEKVAVVTGGSGGLGQGICQRLAQEGAKIVVDYHSHADEAEKVKEKIEQLGSEALIVQADLSKVEQINNLVQKSIDRFGKVDILVNNAGIEKRADFWDVTEADYDLVLNLNSRVLKARKTCGQVLCRQVRSSTLKLYFLPPKQ